MTAFDWAQRASIWEYHMGDGVNTADPMEAALACPDCINDHCDALSGRPNAPRIVKRYVPSEWVDPPRSDDAT